MSILDRIENLMETVIEGLFRKSNKGRLQPVEIGKRLIKTMESQKESAWLGHMYRINILYTFIRISLLNLELYKAHLSKN